MPPSVAQRSESKAAHAEERTELDPDRDLDHWRIVEFWQVTHGRTARVPF